MPPCYPTGAGENVAPFQRRYAMRMYALLILAAGGLIAANAAQDDAAKQDMKKLQGTWKAVATASNPQEQRFHGGKHIVI